MLKSLVSGTLGPCLYLWTSLYALPVQQLLALSGCTRQSQSCLTCVFEPSFMFSWRVVITPMLMKRQNSRHIQLPLKAIS